MEPGSEPGPRTDLVRHLLSDDREAVITGYVRAAENGNEPVIRIRVAGPHGFEVDTGFTGHLTLAPAIVEDLRLVSSGNRDVALADGSVTDVASYDAEVLWHGYAVPVEALAISGVSLIGMEMLQGSELRVRAVPDGRVEIEELA